MIKYSDIAIPGVPKPTLTYSVPDRLHDKLIVGVRVLVPLGKRIVTGFCIRIHHEPPSIATKQIRDVIDEEPVFTHTMIDIARWIHQYYFCPFGDALKAALPQGIEIESEQFVHILTDDLTHAKQQYEKSKTKIALLDALQTGEYISVPELTFLSGIKNISPHLRELEHEGYIAIDSVISEPKVKKKKILAVRLLDHWAHADNAKELIDILEKRAPKQVNVVSVLLQSRRSGLRTMPMTELLRQALASSAQVHALEEKEIVAVESEEVEREFTVKYEEPPQSFELSERQQHAVQQIASASDAGIFHPYLLHGVTASGKTQVYIDAIRHVLKNDRTAIVLVPEISLTPQLVYRFKFSFGKDVAVLHSRMSPGERYDAWRLTLKKKYKVIVGVRSAIFAPLERPGLIVVDEEHESSYKQNDLSPRYHARDVALVRARLENAVVVLGSATPSCESFENARQGKYDLLELTERVDNATLPTIIPVDMVQARKQNTMHGSFTTELLSRIEDRLKKKEGVIILQNRRGFAPRVECNECGHVEQCANCSISMTYHKVRNQLRCHYCGSIRSVPDVCPRCGGIQVEHLGIGTQRVEEDLAALLPHARIIRMDLDTTSHKGSHDAYLTAFSEGDADILLGTQMVSKGLDFPRVTLVGVINADQSLALPDFRSSERTFQILTQVSGRSGRGKIAGEVIIQTTQPNHPVLQSVFNHDYHGYISSELRARKAFHYPPYSRLVLIEFSGEKEEEVASLARRYSNAIPNRSELFYKHPATPAAIRRINKRYRYHILLKVSKQKDPGGKILAEYLQKVGEKMIGGGMKSSVRITIDVDPQNLM